MSVITPHGSADMKFALFSGGAGSRLWPLSRKASPKQFQPLLAGESLFQHIVHILQREYSSDSLFVITGRDYVEAIREQAPAIPPENIVAEPEMRDTLAAVGYAAAVIERRFPGTPLTTLWGADHIIRHGEVFLQALRAAATLAATAETIVKIDVRPSAASTQFGYVEIAQSVGTIDGFEAFEFVRFTEKPDVETARRYVQGGHHLWNTGYFVWSSATILDLYRRYAPEAHSALTRIMAAIGTPDEARVTEEQYAAIPKTSVDYGVFSHIEPGAMQAIPADLGWADIGAWDAFRSELAPSEGANVVVGDHLGIDTHSSVIYSATGRLIATLGLDNLVIVDTPDALFVAPTDRAQEVKKIVERLKQEGRTEFL